MCLQNAWARQLRNLLSSNLAWPPRRSDARKSTLRLPYPCIARKNASISTIYRSLELQIPSRNHYNLGTAKNVPLMITIQRSMSQLTKSGSDLFANSLSSGIHRKIILESYAPSGVDVKGLIMVGDSPEEGDLIGDDKVVHMNGSIMAFPDACFLWDVETPSKVSLASLSVVKLYRPTVEYLFIGCDSPLLPQVMQNIKKEFRKKGIVVEAMDIMNAMGTFNILNSEDRRVACALVINPEEKS